MKALDKSQVEQYQREGYLVIDDVLAPEVMGELRAVTDSFVDQSRHATSSNNVLDFEPADRSGEHHLRRIKSPERQAPIYAEVMGAEAVLNCVR